MAQLAASGTIQPMLAARIGLYLHAAVPGKGLQAFSGPQRAALLKAWVPAGAAADGGGYAIGEVGCMSENQDATNTPYRQIFGPAGRYPIEINMNCSGDGSGSGRYTAASPDHAPGHVFPGYITDTDLQLFESAFREAHDHGADNVAMFATPNNLARDLEDPFATGAFYKNDRKLALYGGGVALDTPVEFFLHNPSPLYQVKVEEMIRWGVANHLRVSMVLSPWTWTTDQFGHSGADGYDTGFVEHVSQFVAILRQAGALPTQWVVENYSTTGTSNQPGSSVEKESLNAAALFLANRNAVAPPGAAAAAVSGLSEAQIQQFPQCLLQGKNRFQ